MEFSTSTLGTALEAAQTGYSATQGDVILFGVGIFLFSVIIGVAFAAMNRGRRGATAAVGGGRRRGR